MSFRQRSLVIWFSGARTTCFRLKRCGSREAVATASLGSGFGSLALGLRGLVTKLAEAEKAGAPMPSVGVVRDRLITGIARGYGELDWTALGLIAAEEAGLYAVPSDAAD